MLSMKAHFELFMAYQNVLKLFQFKSIDPWAYHLMIFIVSASTPATPGLQHVKIYMDQMTIQFIISFFM